jgi:hypothetical protein
LNAGEEELHYSKNPYNNQPLAKQLVSVQETMMGPLLDLIIFIM